MPLKPALRPSWRPSALADLPDIDRIGDAIHVDLPERPEVFAEKVTLFPAGCFVFCQGSSVFGYGLAHPWMLLNIPPLGQFLQELPPAANCLFIHDVVVMPEARGRNAALSLVRLYRDVATRHHLRHLALVAVYGTQTLWSRFGFEAVSDSRLTEKLSTYSGGGTAQYMTCELGAVLP